MVLNKFKLKDVCTLINGRAYKNDELLNIGKYKVLRVGNFFSRNKWYYSDLELQEDKYCNFGDLLFAWSASFGPKIWDGEKTIYHYHIWKIVTNENVDKLYLYYYLKHNVNKMLAGTHGSVMAHLTKSAMEQMEIELPSLEYQKKVAQILKIIDDKITLNSKLNANLEEVGNQLFNKYFSTCIDKPNSEIRELGDVITGKTPSTKIKSYYGNDIPFIKTPDMHGNMFLLNVENYLSREGAESQKNKYLPPFTVIMACIGAGAGAIGITSEYSQTNQQINAVLSKWPCYTYYILKSKTNDLRNMGSAGSTMININKSTFERCAIYIPDKNVIENFESFVWPLFSQILNSERQNNLLMLARNELLPKLMSGEIDLTNIDIEI